MPRPFALPLAILLLALGACSGGGGRGGAAAPVLSRINGSSAPASPKSVAIELTGAGFGPSPGLVRFQQGAGTPVDVVPPAANWGDGSVIVTVPNSGLTAPGTVSVSVITAGGLGTAAIDLTLTVTPTFNPSSITWAATQPLPAGRRGHAAAVVPRDPTAAWVYVIGGNDGAADLSSVLMAALDRNGNVGAWSTVAALPSTVACAGIAVATSGNSLVSGTTACLYLVGGQESAGGAPGGTSNVTLGRVDTTTGTVTWSATTALPAARVGARAAVLNGTLFVTGGVDTAGNAVAQVLAAPIQSDGSLGAFTAGTDLPTPVAFHECFAFGGNLYVIGGDTGPVLDPFSVSSVTATTQTRYARVVGGVMGSWTSGASLNKARAKASLLVAFGQLMLYEGAYGATNTEGTRSSINADGSLGSWNGLTGGSIPGLNVFNGAGVASPLLTAADAPRFLLLGGDLVQTPGTLSATVLSTTAP